MHDGTLLRAPNPQAVATWPVPPCLISPGLCYKSGYMSSNSGWVERVIDIDSNGHSSTHFGVPICKGPGVYRMMVTWPSAEEGKVIEIPRAQIREICPAQPGLRGEMPRILVTAGV